MEKTLNMIYFTLGVLQLSYDFYLWITHLNPHLVFSVEFFLGVKQGERRKYNTCFDLKYLTMNDVKIFSEVIYSYIFFTFLK